MIRSENARPNAWVYVDLDAEADVGSYVQRARAAVEAAGTKDFRGVQAHVGEVIAWRNLFWSLSEAMVRNPMPWVDGYVLPNGASASAYQVIATIAYPKVKYIVEQACSVNQFYRGNV